MRRAVADVAGIHGHPQVPWDGVNGSTSNLPGYCTHGATTFPTWHRPYLALFEVRGELTAHETSLTKVQQVLWDKAQSIALLYPEDVRPLYVEAAWWFRIPYWDWASHPALPDVVQTSSIAINTPSGRAWVENPLYDYNFHWNSDGNMFLNKRIIFDDFPSTVRHYNNETQQSDQAAASAQMQANAGTYMSKVFQLFTDSSDYSTFSCVTPSGVNNAANNIEIIHGNVHNCSNY